MSTYLKHRVEWTRMPSEAPHRYVLFLDGRPLGYTERPAYQRGIGLQFNMWKCYAGIGESAVKFANAYHRKEAFQQVASQVLPAGVTTGADSSRAMDRTYFNLANLPPQVAPHDYDDRMMWLAWYYAGADETSTVEEAREALVGIYVDGVDAAEQIALRQSLLPGSPATLPPWVVVDWDKTWEALKPQFRQQTIQNWLYVFRRPSSGNVAAT